MDRERREIPTRSGGPAGRTLARNAVLNFVGQALPLALAIVAIPAIVSRLGVERLGVLSLAWTMLGSVGLFDLGMGRATTKFVAEALGRDRRQEVPHLVWTAVTVQAAVGGLATAMLVGLTPFFVERVLSLPDTLVGETTRVFYLVALTVPIVMVSTSFAGALEAAQRFDLVTAVRIPANAATFLIPLAGALIGLALPSIVALLALARVLALGGFVLLGARVFPELGRPRRLRAAALSRLWAFGGWVAASGALAPLLRYLDRYLIASLVSVSAAAYYSIPFDLVERMWVIPASLVGPLFPAFSALNASREGARVRSLFLRSVKYLVVLTGPVALALGTCAEPILRLWLGVEFAEHGALTLRILSLAALVGVLAPVPGAVIESHGRPDLIAKLYVLYLPLNVVLVWGLVRALGLPGAAVAVGLRTLLDTVFVFVLAARIAHLGLAVMIRDLVRPGVLLAFVGGAVWLAARVPEDGLSLPLVAASVTAVFAVAAWRWVLAEDERGRMRASPGKASP